jgi:hypothetical protein
MIVDLLRAQEAPKRLGKPRRTAPRGRFRHAPSPHNDR